MYTSAVEGGGKAVAGEAISMQARKWRGEGRLVNRAHIGCSWGRERRSGRRGK